MLVAVTSEGEIGWREWKKIDLGLKDYRWEGEREVEQQAIKDEFGGMEGQKEIQKSAWALKGDLQKSVCCPQHWGGGSQPFSPCNPI